MDQDEVMVGPRERRGRPKGAVDNAMRGTPGKPNVRIALKAALDAGMDLSRVEIDPSGKITLTAARGAPAADEPNEWDEVLPKPAATPQGG